ncbi:hypothetical protein ARMA_1156 [Ardenticatena maritima]|uniref:Methyltransferase domain-containing protein n=1 Tax=Ardenticatena maritima TaxID=872965 RepID=A0A0M8K6D9_9CHLR|nr:class I SAM-dependent methyltransferase [Ardenticatena maritima]KPL89270.1 hypothetical protein SE16_01995 [Ardenticatena maritima]GAP62733.1 hypothetical protein ARMA_1156 [Ardenticatena maritima]
MNDVRYYQTRGRWLAGAIRAGTFTPEDAQPRFEFLMQTPIARARRLLHIGSGTAGVSLLLGRHGFRPVAVELSADLAALAREASLARGWAVAVLNEDFRTLDFPPYFDAILADGMLPFGQPSEAETVEAVQKVADLLRPGGYLLFGSPEWRPAPTWRRRYTTPQGEVLEEAVFDAETRTVLRTLTPPEGEPLTLRRRWQTPAEMRAMLETAGLVVVQQWRAFDPQAAWQEAEDGTGLVWLARRR